MNREREANLIARNLLMPEFEFRYWCEKKSVDSLVDHFLVPADQIMKRFEDLDIKHIYNE